MYESQFLLKRRPFAATPDPRCFLATAPVRAALDELVVCVEQGLGVAVASAPAGTGKTLLSELLRLELEDRFEVILLRHASFLTRRALLQTILADLNHAYRRHEEQELRLELVPAIRALSPGREALVLICDEAHMLSEDLLEELRILSDLAEQGRPLVRLVLVGQPGLEETLASPGLEALNQRIRAHVCLDSFDRSSALSYIDYRITWAGGRTAEVFTAEALELICRASQGVPRCINQLCDHALLLAYVAEQKPVAAATILEALKDLRQLPLHWNDSLSSDVSPGHRNDVESDAFTIETPIAAPPVQFPAVQFPPVQYQSVEFGADLPIDAIVEGTGPETSISAVETLIHDEVDDSPADDFPEDEYTPEDYSEEFNTAESDELEQDQCTTGCDDVFESPEVSVAPTATTTATTTAATTAATKSGDSPTAAIRPMQTGDVVEEIVCDRYAAIDGGFALPESCGTHREHRTEFGEPATVELQQDTCNCNRVHRVGELSAAVTDLKPASGSTDEFDAVCARLDELLRDVPDPPEWDSESLELGSDDSFAVPPEDAEQRMLDDDLGSLEASLEEAVYQLSRELQRETGTAEDAVTASGRLQELLADRNGRSSTVEVGAESRWEKANASDAMISGEAPQSEENRPYRYLFSRLRRKQQGLA